MWKFVAALLLLGSSVLAHGQQTAYEALRVVGTQLNRAYVSHIIAVTGINGAPQPKTWQILIDDSRARGGIREVEVSNGRVTSERTPVRSSVGETVGIPIDTSRLNLDSSGAYTVAQHTAERSHIVFDAATYTLRNDERGNPLWKVALQSRDGAAVGTIYIGANHGTVTRTEGLFTGTNDPAIAGPPRDNEEPDDSDDDTRGNSLKARIKRAFYEVRDDAKRTFDRVHRSFDDFVNGN
jgi:hypothetical protein